ncbi:MAG: hypothetical protein K2P81_10430 [Bacteriovoracaceae bacterium]|nr:hypothetical protein [Bacteriovoracaceae bacterium]
MAHAQTTHPVKDLTLCNQIDIEGDWMSIGFDSVWEMSDGVLNRLAADTNKIIAKIPISYGPFRGLVTGEGYIWVPDVGKDQLHQVDPKTNKIIRTIDLKLSDSEGSITVGDGSVWIATDNENGKSKSLKRIDVKTGKIVADIAMPSTVSGATFENGKVWLTSPGDGKVIVVDPKTNQIKKSLNVGAGPRFISSGAGSVWVLNQYDGNIVRVNPETMEVSATIKANLPGGGGDITYGEGFIWATMPGVPVVKIDPNTNQVVDRFEGYGMGDAIRVGLGSVWVSGGKLHRIVLPK